MTQIKEISGIAITDEYGMTFQSAVAVIFNASETTQRTLTGNEDTGEYDLLEDVKAIAYEVNYYYDSTMKEKGFRGRPLAVDNGIGGFTRVLEVNLNISSVECCLGKSSITADESYTNLLLVSAPKHSFAIVDLPLPLRPTMRPTFQSIFSISILPVNVCLKLSTLTS